MNFYQHTARMNREAYRVANQPIPAILTEMMALGKELAALYEGADPVEWKAVRNRVYGDVDGKYAGNAVIVQRLHGAIAIRRAEMAAEFGDEALTADGMTGGGYECEIPY
jgi:hypothetical protein